MTLVSVALPVPVFGRFDYLIPSCAKPIIGGRVRVPFGRRKLVGVVTGLPETSKVARAKLKPIIETIDTEAVVDGELLMLAQFLSNYYHYPLGEVLSAMLPASLRQGKAFATTQTAWRTTQIEATFSKQAHKQREAYTLICTHAHGAVESKIIQQGVAKSTLKKLHEKGLIEPFDKSLKQDGAAAQGDILTEAAFSLNGEQQAAFDAVHNKLGSYAGFLLAGVTGSGKTEVYLQLIEAVLKAGKQALVLVPEIGLTPQTLSRFQNRFGVSIVTLHSHMSDGERLSAWAALKTGEARICIGTRLSVLAPFSTLGLVIVDEAHDTSYKQQNGLRYHARDVAMYRAQKLGCPVVLGSATPSFESLHRARTGKLVQLSLTQRAGKAKPPKFVVADMRGQNLPNGLTQWLGAGLGYVAAQHMAQALAKGEQVLVFLNRRGYAPVLVCAACGWQADCPRCDARLTLHKTPVQLLKCHHCGWQQVPPHKCADCGSTNLDALGMGTARLEEQLISMFADHAVLRIDADTTRKKNAWVEIYQQVADNPSCVLLGTQMLAKGHHFENVTLVVLPNVDQGLLSSDFRAPERVAQLMMQVAGRAGRGDKAGYVLVQSYQPDNPLLHTLIHSGYAAFAAQGLAERAQLGLPPYTFAALVRADSKHEVKTTQALDAIKQLIAQNNPDSSEPFAMYGPIAAPMQRVAGRFHGHLLVLSKSRQQLQQCLAVCWQQALSLQAVSQVRVSLDVDPMGF